MMFEVYQALEQAKKVLIDAIQASPKVDGEAAKALGSVLTTMDYLWQHRLTDAERDWLDGRTDDGEND